MSATPVVIKVPRSVAMCVVLGFVLAFGSSFPQWALATAEPEKSQKAELANGTIGADQWRAEALAPEEADEREEGNVCLSIFYLEVWLRGKRAEGSEVAQCGALGVSQVMIQTYTVRRRHRRPHTAVAFLLDGSAVRIVLKLKGQPADQIRLRHLSPQPATAERRLAYFARGYARPFCVQELVAYGSAGQQLFRLGAQGCY
jgi:hypothetical protein